VTAGNGCEDVSAFASSAEGCADGAGETGGKTALETMGAALAVAVAAGGVLPPIA
jgi:hypothetical protein